MSTSATAKTSPSKASTRTYDSRLVSREMHRLGTLAAIPPLTATSSANISLSSSAPSAPSVIASTPSLPHHTHPHTSTSIPTSSLERDNPWGALHVHVLPLFNEDPLQVPIEELNLLVRRHIQSVLSASPSKALATLESDTADLIAAGLFTLNTRLVGMDDDKLVDRLVDIWDLFWVQILPYIEGVLLPLQTDPLLSSLYRPKQHRTSSPTRPSKSSLSLSHSASLSLALNVAPPGDSRQFRDPIDGRDVRDGPQRGFRDRIVVRDIALRAFRDRIVVHRYAKLLPRVGGASGRETLARLGESGRARAQQMFLILASLRPPTPLPTSRSLILPTPQPSAAESAIAELLRSICAANAAFEPRERGRRGQGFGHGQAGGQMFDQGYGYRHPGGQGHEFSQSFEGVSTGPLGGSMARPSRALSFLSGGMPRDRRGRIGARGNGSSSKSGGGNDPIHIIEEGGDETPRIGGDHVRQRGREILESLRSPDPYLERRGSVGGWGLGMGNDDSAPAYDDDDDDDDDQDAVGDAQYAHYQHHSQSNTKSHFQLQSHSRAHDSDSDNYNENDLTHKYANVGEDEDIGVNADVETMDETMDWDKAQAVVERMVGMRTRLSAGRRTSESASAGGTMCGVLSGNGAGTGAGI